MTRKSKGVKGVNIIIYGGGGGDIFYIKPKK